jgi:hypothetical protein
MVNHNLVASGKTCRIGTVGLRSSVLRRAEKRSAFRQSRSSAALRKVGGMRCALPPYALSCELQTHGTGEYTSPACGVDARTVAGQETDATRHCWKHPHPRRYRSACSPASGRGVLMRRAEERSVFRQWSTTLHPGTPSASSFGCLWCEDNLVKLPFIVADLQHYQIGMLLGEPSAQFHSTDGHRSRAGIATQQYGDGQCNASRCRVTFPLWHTGHPAQAAAIPDRTFHRIW